MALIASGRERPFTPEELLLSGTGPDGRLRAANDVFVRGQRLRDRGARRAPTAIAAASGDAARGRPRRSAAGRATRATSPTTARSTGSWSCTCRAASPVAFKPGTPSFAHAPRRLFGRPRRRGGGRGPRPPAPRARHLRGRRAARAALRRLPGGDAAGASSPRSRPARASAPASARSPTRPSRSSKASTAQTTSSPATEPSPSPSSASPASSSSSPRRSGCSPSTRSSPPTASATAPRSARSRSLKKTRSDAAAPEILTLGREISATVDLLGDARFHVASARLATEAILSAPCRPRGAARRRDRRPDRAGRASRRGGRHGLGPAGCGLGFGRGASQDVPVPRTAGPHRGGPRLRHRARAAPVRGDRPPSPRRGRPSCRRSPRWATRAQPRRARQPPRRARWRGSASRGRPARAVQSNNESGDTTTRRRVTIGSPYGFKRVVGQPRHVAARHHVVGQEPGLLAVAERVVGPAWSVVVADRDVHRQSAPGAGHAHVEQASFLVDGLARAGGHAGGEVAVVDGQDVDGVPLEALGGVDRGQREVVLVEMRWLGDIRARGGWVQDQLRDEVPRVGAWNAASTSWSRSATRTAPSG